MAAPLRLLRTAACCGLGLLVLYGSAFEVTADPADSPLAIWRDIFARPDTNLAAIPAPQWNPVTSAKVDLGKKLFFDTRLSGGTKRSCATCHQPERAFTDGRRGASSLDGTTELLNAPSLLNLAWSNQLFHDGRSKSLEDQARHPIEHPGEMAGSWPRIIERLNGEPSLRAAFRKAFPNEPEVTQKSIVAALATYERALVSPQSRFDRFIEGDGTALTRKERAGFRLFVGKAGCISCHSGWRLTDDKLHNVGTASAKAPRGTPANGLIRTPGLRELSKTAPYMHDGSLPTLERVIEHYLDLDQGDLALSPSLVRPLRLSENEKSALKAFLSALN